MPRLPPRGCGESKSKEEKDQDLDKRVADRAATDAADEKRMAERFAQGRKVLADKVAPLEAIVKAPRRAPGKLPSSPPPDDKNTIILPADPADAHAFLTATKPAGEAWWAWSAIEKSILGAAANNGAPSSDMFEFLSQAKYLALVSSVDYTRPYVATSGSGYYPGKRVAEVRLYALPAGTYLGGVKFDAKTDPQVVTKDDVNAVLEQQLAEHVTAAMYAALAKGGEPIAFNVGWNALQNKRMAIELPAHWELDPKDTGKILLGQFGVEDAFQSISVYEEPAGITFAPDAACSARVAAYAKELGSTVKTAAVEQVDGAPTCLAMLDWRGKRLERLRYLGAGRKELFAAVRGAGRVRRAD